MDSVKPRVLAPGRYAIDVEPIPPRNRNNREVHLDYLKHLKESSLDATKKPSSSDSSNGKLFINDNISLKELRNFVDKSMQEESVLEHVGNNDINSCTSRENQGEKVSSNSSGRSGQPLEEDAYDDYEDQFEENPCSYQEFCDQFDFKVKGLGRIFTLGEQCPLTRLTKSKVVPAKQTENVSTSKTVITKKLSHTSQKPLTRYQHRNQQYQTVPIILPTSPENQAIAASMQFAIAYANQQEPTKIRDPSFQTLHLCLFSNAGRTYHPLQIQVDLNKTVRYIRTDNGTEFVNQVLTEYYESVSIFHQESVPRTPQQNDVIERRNRTLVEAARTMLIFSKAPMFLCSRSYCYFFYTKIVPHSHSHNKNPIQTRHIRSLILPFSESLVLFVTLQMTTRVLENYNQQLILEFSLVMQPNRKGYRIYNKRTRRIMETIHIQFDELSEPMALVQLSTGPAPTFLTPGQIKPPRVERPVSPAAAVQVPAISAGTPSSTTIDQDAPSPSHSPSSSELQPSVSHQGVAAGSILIKDNLFAHANNVPFVNVFAPEPSFKASSSEDVSSAESTYVTQPHHHLGK
ncbi:retrovirus-related pol polyprotein from transposon TNT 1-94 [Tanacetum coccineum]